MKQIFFLFALLLLGFSVLTHAETVKYELFIEKIPKNMSGKVQSDFALTVNGSIPGPTLEFTEGDEAEIVVHNKLLGKEEVSIHWHGLLLPPEMDGVPYVNTPPIFPGKSHTFKFKIRQHGTYWYHSHTRLQEQKGVYGAFIIHPKKPTLKVDKDIVVVLSDWTDENPDRVIKNLRKDGDYYLYKKKSVRSYWGALNENSLIPHLSNEWDRMGGMDLSDVGYDAFLFNGKRDSQLGNLKKGQTARVRVINAAASSYFYLSLGDQLMNVVSADGMDVVPTKAKEIFIGMAETYDFLFSPPDDRNYQFKATVQDVTGFASGFIGNEAGVRVEAPRKPYPNLYEEMNHGAGHGAHENHGGAEHLGHADHSSHLSHASHAGHDHSAHLNKETIIESLTVDNLKSPVSTKISKFSKIHELELRLGGDMERYVWHINGKAIHEDTYIDINENDLVRFKFVNLTMMHHPMHLHGHFFRVLNDKGDFAPLKHTVDVGPHSERTIEFFANEPGQWMLHCHNLYHMKTGMGRVIRYTSYKPPVELSEHAAHDPHLHDHGYFKGSALLATNVWGLNFTRLKTHHEFEVGIASKGYKNTEHLEASALFRRFVSNYSHFFVGGEARRENARHPIRGVLGFGLVLPLLIESHLQVDSRFEIAASLEKRFQWFEKIYSDLEFEFRQKAEIDYSVNLMYEWGWHVSSGALLDGDTLGLAIQARF